MHGQRDRAVWQAVNRLAGARLAKPGEQIQAVFFIDLNCPACARFWRWFDTPAHRQWATLWAPPLVHEFQLMQGSPEKTENKAR